MFVCTHGNVKEYCHNHGMFPIEKYKGELLDYDGTMAVLVTDKEMGEAEYYFLKGSLIARGVELVSIHYDDSEIFTQVGKYVAKIGGRYKFGFQNIKGKVVLTEKGREVVNRIFELRDMGYSYRQIIEDSKVRHLDGRKLNVSTAQMIVKNREMYEKEGL